MKELRVSKQGKHISKINLLLIRRYHRDTEFKSWVDYYAESNVRVPRTMLGILLLAEQIRNKPGFKEKLEEEKTKIESN